MPLSYDRGVAAAASHFCDKQPVMVDDGYAERQDRGDFATVMLSSMGGDMIRHAWCLPAWDLV